jgi:hypothetical protein
MDACAEREVSIRVSLKIKVLRMLVRLRIHFGRGNHRHDLVSLLQSDATEHMLPVYHLHPEPVSDAVVK